MILLRCLRKLVRWLERRFEREEPCGWKSWVYHRELIRLQTWAPDHLVREGPGPFYTRLSVYHAPYNGHGKGDWRWYVGADCDRPPYQRAGYADTAADAMRAADKAFAEIASAREGRKLS